MPPVLVILLAVIPAAAAVVEQPAPPLKVLTWNVEQPQRSRLQGVIDFLVRQQADVIALQEVYEGESGEIRDQLRSRTSRPWAGAFRGGVLLLTHLTVLDRQELWMPFPDRYVPGRSAVGLTVRVGGVQLQVFNTHLACCDDVAARQRQVEALIDWMGRHPKPAIVAGDFNAVPGDVEIGGRQTPYGRSMAAEYIDLWRGPGGETYRNPQPSRRIDYWFQSRAGAATVVADRDPRVLDVCTGWSLPPAEAGEGGVTCLADHRPVEVTFRIGSPSPAGRGGAPW